jgi:beta-carotene 15,15'-dioxygenase
MLRNILLLTGIVLLVTQQFLPPLSVNVYFSIFLAGIAILGIPHGAADLLIADQHAQNEAIRFSPIKFFVNYLGRLIAFAVIIWAFPVIGNCLFILFAAYHFGETDLYKFNTSSTSGKLFVLSYGLLIIAVILLPHFETIKPLFLLFPSGTENIASINFIEANRYIILTCIGLLFFVATFLYFNLNKSFQYNSGNFLLQLPILLFVLFYLPMLMGFTFYFIIWHSILSLKNIVVFLQKDGSISSKKIIKQIVLYSFLAMAGLSIFGLTGFMFVNNNTMMVYIFLGLAVLTAPHMEIMHLMYTNIRKQKATYF